MSITCPRCGMTSHNANDVREGYCGRCHDWTGGNRKISLRQAAARGIERLRLQKWACSYDHVKIDIIDGAPGPWVHLWSPMNLAINGRDNIAHIINRADDEVYEPYTGPLPDSEEYKRHEQQFDQRFNDGQE